MPAYWLMKSEPDELSIRDLQHLGTARWDGVRNYQARNFIRSMNSGDLFFFYHPVARSPASPVSPASKAKPTPISRPWIPPAPTTTPRPAPGRTPGAPATSASSKPSPRSFHWPG